MKPGQVIQTSFTFPIPNPINLSEVPLDYKPAQPGGQGKWKSDSLSFSLSAVLVLPVRAGLTQDCVAIRLAATSPGSRIRKTANG